MTFSKFIILFHISITISAQEVWTLDQCINHAERNNLTIEAQELKSELNILRKNNFYKKVIPEFSSDLSHGYNWGQAIDPFTNEFATDRIRTDNLIISSEFLIFNGLKKLNEFKYLNSQIIIDSLNIAIEKDKVKMAICKQYFSILVNQKEISLLEKKLINGIQDKVRAKKLLESGKITNYEYLDISFSLSNDSLNLEERNTDSPQLYLNRKLSTE